MVMANEVDQSWQQECMWTCWKRAYTLYASQEDREQGDIFGNWISKDVRITQTICVVTFCWKHGIYKQEKVIWPCMSAFFFFFLFCFVLFWGGFGRNEEGIADEGLQDLTCPLFSLSKTRGLQRLRVVQQIWSVVISCLSWVNTFWFNESFVWTRTEKLGPEQGNNLYKF